MNDIVQQEHRSVSLHCLKSSSGKEHGIILNIEKCYFRQTEVEFPGHKVSQHGVQLLREKLDAISDFPIPTSITELRSFLGMAQQLSRFTPEFATTAEPLRGLLSTENT